MEDKKFGKDDELHESSGSGGPEILLCVTLWYEKSGHRVSLSLITELHGVIPKLMNYE